MQDMSELSGLADGELDLAADRARWTALVVLCAGMLMIVLDVTIVNVALPSIQQDLGFSATGLAWVVNAYLISFGGLLLLAGRLGDLAGRRNVFLAGLAIFTLASMACGLAQSQEMLVGARFVQGAGGALTSAVILGVIVTLFPDQREMARAIGVYAFVASAGGAVGLLAGGILTQAINWHWIFFVNLPIGIATAVLALRVVPQDQGTGLRQGADVAGALLITSSMMLSVYTIVKPASQDGWLAGRTLAFGAVSLALLAGFIIRQLTARNPLMPLRILAVRKIAAANVIQVLTVAGMFGVFFLGALYLRLVEGYSPLRIGLAFLPVASVMGAVSVRYADRLSTRFGARATLETGLVLIGAALTLFAMVPVHGGYALHILPAMLMMGAGAGLAFPVLMTVAMGGVASDDAGLASGLVNTTAQVGGALGLAVLATVAAGRTSALTARGESTGPALTDGYQLAFWISDALVAAAIVVTATLVRRSDLRQRPSSMLRHGPPGVDDGGGRQRREAAARIRSGRHTGVRRRRGRGRYRSPAGHFRCRGAGVRDRDGRRDYPRRDHRGHPGGGAQGSALHTGGCRGGPGDLRAPSARRPDPELAADRAGRRGAGAFLRRGRPEGAGLRAAAGELSLRGRAHGGGRRGHPRRAR
jgi:EmrB/QacA subfamily drug resistance transporter